MQKYRLHQKYSCKERVVKCYNPGCHENVSISRMDYHITYEYTNDTTVITHPINQETGNPSCILEWKYDGNWWTGSVKGECIINNARVESFIQFNGSLYRSLDTGYNVDTGDFVWGTEPGNGLFEFERLE